MVNASLNWASIVGIVLAVCGGGLYFLRGDKNHPIYIVYSKLLQKLASSSRSTIEGIFLADKNQKCSGWNNDCLLYTSPSPRDPVSSRMPSSA